MSHHYSGPNLGFPGGDARLDFTDLYAFPKPGDPSKSILVMNVHPSVGLKPPGPTTPEPFAPEALYEIKIDNVGDAKAHITYQFRFHSVIVNPNTFLYNTGTFGKNDDGQYNYRQYYSVTRVDDKGSTVLGTDIRAIHDPVIERQG